MKLKLLKNIILIILAVTIFISTMVISNVYADELIEVESTFEEETADDITDEDMSTLYPVDFTIYGKNYSWHDPEQLKDSGIQRGIEWYIFNDGLLYLTGTQTEETTGFLGNWDWTSRYDVKKIYCDFNPDGHDQFGLFNSLCYVEEIQFGSSYDTTGCWRLGYMFYCCDRLQSIDVSTFNTESVSGMGDFQCMFAGCDLLKALDLSSFDTSNGLRFSSLCDGCCELEYVDLSGWDMSNAEKCINIFLRCNNLKMVRLPDDTGGHELVLPHVMYDRDNDNEEYTSIVGTEGQGLVLYSTPVYSIEYELNGGELDNCENPDSYNPYEDEFTLNNPVWEGHTFIGWRECNDDTLRTVVTINSEMSGDLFFEAIWSNEEYTVCFDTGCDINIENQTVDCEDTIEEPDEDEMVRFGYEFTGWYADKECTAEWDFDEPIDRNITLYAGWEMCSYDIDDDGEDDYTFAEADHYGNSLGVDWIIFNDGVLYLFGEQEEDATKASDWGWHAYKTEVRKAQLSFDSDCSIAHLLDGCNNMTEVGYGEYADISAVPNTSYMFSGCVVLTNLDMAQFEISEVYDTSHMFDGCHNLADLTLSNEYTFFNVAYSKDLSYMFRNCSAIETLDLSEFGLDEAENVDGMLEDCNGLKYLKTPYTDKYSIMLPKTMYNRFLYNRAYNVIPAMTEPMDLYSTIDENYHHIFVYTSENGSAKASANIEQEGYDIYIEVKPDEGYELDTFYSADVNLELLTDGRIKFNMPDKDVSIQIAFKEIYVAPKYLEEKVINDDGTYTFNLVKGQKYSVSEFKKIKKTAYKVIESKYDKKVAAISTKGVIAAKNVGSATIDMIIGDRNVHMTVNVYNPAFEYDNSKIKYYVVNADDTVAVRFNATGFKPSYMIAAKQQRIATIDPDTGIVTGHEKGNVTVYGIVNGKKYKTIVKVYNPIIIGKDTVKVGKKLALKMKNGVKTTQWSVENGSGMATIDAKGKLTAVAPGTVTVIAINNGRVIRKNITIIQ